MTILELAGPSVISGKQGEVTLALGFADLITSFNPNNLVITVNNKIDEMRKKK